jgi:hypothetical protein
MNQSMSAFCFPLPPRAISIMPDFRSVLVDGLAPGASAGTDPVTNNASSDVAV